MTDGVWLQNLTWEEVKDRIIESEATIILPVGSTEQHGPHLPVGHQVNRAKHHNVLGNNIMTIWSADL